jgi:hypothetical protein
MLDRRPAQRPETAHCVKAERAFSPWAVPARCRSVVTIIDNGQLWLRGLSQLLMAK